MVGATILDIAYGIEVLPTGDPYIRTAEASFESVCQATLPGAFLVDMLPILRHVPEWMPGAGFQRKAKEWKKLTDAVHQEPFAAAKLALVRFIMANLSSYLTSHRVTGPWHRETQFLLTKSAGCRSQW